MEDRDPKADPHDVASTNGVSPSSSNPERESELWARLDELQRRKVASQRFASNGSSSSQDFSQDSSPKTMMPSSGESKGKSANSEDDEKVRLDANADGQVEFPAEEMERLQRLRPGAFRVLTMLRDIAQGVQSSSILGKETLGTHDSRPLPERIDRFHVLERIGSGSFGEVLLAIDPILHRKVAIKRLHPYRLLDPEIHQRFRVERETIARLQHPNIVTVLDAGEEQDQPFIVCEYVPGETLAEWIRDGRAAALSLRDIAQWGSELADALEHSHQKGILHRDIKPSNILLEPIERPNESVLSAAKVADDTRVAEVAVEDDSMADASQRWRPRLTDFGLAKQMDQTRDQTREGLFIGSIQYASPEQLRGGRSWTPASDIYSLGAVLYELVAGHPTHAAPSDFELAKAINESSPSPPSLSRGRRSPDMDAIILKCVATLPQHRYGAASELRDDLYRYLNGWPIKARSVGFPERTWRQIQRAPWASAFLGTAILAILSALVVLTIFNQSLSASKKSLDKALGAALQAQQATERAIEKSEFHRTQAEINANQAIRVRYVSELKQAYLAYEKGRLQEARKFLDRIAPHGEEVDLRCLAWHLLDQRVNASRVALPKLSSPVEELLIDHHRNQLLAVEYQGIVHAFDLNTLMSRGSWKAQPSLVAAALTLDQQHLILAGSERLGEGPFQVAYWDLDSHERVKELFTHDTHVESISISPDGKWLVTGPRYQNVRLTDLLTGEVRLLESDRRNHQTPISPDGKDIAINTDTRTVVLQNPETDVVRSRIGVPFAIAGMDWYDSERIFVAVEDIVLEWNRELQRPMAEYRTAETLTSRIACDATSHRVAVANFDGSVAIFDEVRGDSPGQVAGDAVRGSLSLKHHWGALDSRITALALGPAKTVFVGDDIGGLAVLRPGAQPEKRRSLKKLAVPEVMSSPDRKWIATYRDGRLTIQHAELPRTHELEMGIMPISAVAFSADSSRLFVSDENKDLTCWDLERFTERWRLALSHYGTFVSYDPIEQWLVIAGGFGFVEARHPDDGRLLVQQSGGDGVSSLLFTQNYLITGRKDGTIRYLARDLSELVRIERGHRDAVSCLALAPDGRTLLSGDRQGGVWLWDMMSGDAYGSLYRDPSSKAEVRAIVLNRKQKRLEVQFATELVYHSIDWPRLPESIWEPLSQPESGVAPKLDGIQDTETSLGMSQ